MEMERVALADLGEYLATAGLEVLGWRPGWSRCVAVAARVPPPPPDLPLAVFALPAAERDAALAQHGLYVVRSWTAADGATIYDLGVIGA